jgi:probable rRNA maturation factor
MNRVEISAEELPLPAWTSAARSYILQVLEKLRLDSWDLSVLLCDNAYIRDLNFRYRNRDEPTDVLSFALGENAEYFKVSEDEELRRLLIHGILHLNGMDHGSNEAEEPMLRLQEQILTELSSRHILKDTLFKHRSLSETVF